jgi:hypothetical protein
MPCAHSSCAAPAAPGSLYCLFHTGLGAAAAAAARPTSGASPSTSASPSRKRSREVADLPAGADFPISVLFIPFEAAGRFYKMNAARGVFGQMALLEGTGVPMDVGDSKMDIAPAAPHPQWMTGAEIATALPSIVRQECERIRNIYNPDAKYAENHEALMQSGGPGRTAATLPPGWAQRVENKLKGYSKHYPILLFLSENPTGQAFPDRIDSGVPGLGYVMKYALDRGVVDGIRRVNEMAVYLREDFDRRLQTTPTRGALFMQAGLVTRRPDSALFKPTKDEYILRVTVGTWGGPSCTVAGVHLRAGLTGSSAHHREAEMRALRQFCAAHGIQLMVGDFNMDLQEAVQGSRGAFADAKHEPRFLVPPSGGGAIPEFIQQFSSATGSSHYMGHYQADTKELAISGVSVYGHLGASGGRSLGVGGAYYSDHPSVYVRVESARIGLGATASSSSAWASASTSASPTGAASATATATPTPTGAASATATATPTATAATPAASTLSPMDDVD